MCVIALRMTAKRTIGSSTSSSPAGCTGRCRKVAGSCFFEREGKTETKNEKEDEEKQEKKRKGKKRKIMKNGEGERERDFGGGKPQILAFLTTSQIG